MQRPELLEIYEKLDGDEGWDWPRGVCLRTFDKLRNQFKRYSKHGPVISWQPAEIKADYQSDAYQWLCEWVWGGPYVKA